MEGSFDSDSYWNRSASKGFSFDDEDDDYRSDFSAGGRVRDVLNDDAISEASFDNSIAGSTLNLSIKSIISEDCLKTILEEQSLDDRVLCKGITAEEELKLLRRQIQTTLYSPSPAATAHKLLLGKTVPLEVFKSLHEKEALLDAVLGNGGGDGVIGVLLFLKRSLNRTCFHRILQQRPKALKHYLSDLQQQRSHSHESIEMLHHFGRSEAAILLQYKAAMETQDLSARKQKLQQLVARCANNATSVVRLYQQFFQASLKLLELIEKERHALDNAVDHNATPIQVLYACCQKHPNWQEQDMTRPTSPFRLCAEQQISAAQFEWTALNERSIAQAYADLPSIFERIPTWHPMKQKQFHISFSLEAAVVRLHALQAPPTVLHFFLSQVSDAAEKLVLAQRIKCTKAVIDALISLKDVAQLTQLKDSLPDRSEEQFYCEKALKTLQNKRWSTDHIKLKL